jgi:hypothetical protein
LEKNTKPRILKILVVGDAPNGTRHNIHASLCEHA